MAAAAAARARCAARPMVRDGPAQKPPYPAEKARGGGIILRNRRHRLIFAAGLAGAVVLAALIHFFG